MQLKSRLPATGGYAVLLAGLLVGLLAGSISAAEWGDLTGTFVIQGEPPAPQPVAITKDQAFCGRFDIVDESLVVSSNGGIKNIVVFMYLKGLEEKPDPHPDYASSAGDDVLLENRECRFQPRVVLLRTSQTLVISNPDEVGHNSKIDCLNSDNLSINPQIPPGGKIEHRFAGPESLAALVSCSSHPWMTAKVIVKDHPYMAVTDDQGRFAIKNVPAGTWQFRFWHEEAGYIQEVEIGGVTQSWRRGLVEVDVRAGENSLGQVTVPPSAFAK